jgi:H+/Cl- antiporter ClcA
LQLIGSFKLIKAAAVCSFVMMTPIAGSLFGCENLASSSVDLMQVLLLVYCFGRAQFSGCGFVFVKVVISSICSHYLVLVCWFY